MRGIVGIGLDQDLVQQPVRVVLTQDVAENTIGYPKTTAQKGPVDIFELDQTEPAKRCAPLESVTERPIESGQTKEVYDQTRAGSPTAHVIMQISVQLLEPSVKIGREGNDQYLNVDREELEAACELVQNRSGLGLADRGLFNKGGGRARQKPINVLVGEKDASQLVVDLVILTPEPVYGMRNELFKMLQMYS